MRYLRLFALGIVAAACGDAVVPGPVDGVAFTYEGGVSGAFHATGAFDSTGVRPWAGAWPLDGTPFLVVAAAAPRTATSHDVVGIVLPRSTPGTSPISTVCPPEGCADLFATFGRTNVSGGSEFLQGCFVISGHVTIATITESRVTGSFAGSGECFGSDDIKSTFTVSGGVFDLPLMQPEATSTAAVGFAVPGYRRSDLSGSAPELRNWEM